MKFKIGFRATLPLATEDTGGGGGGGLAARTERYREEGGGESERLGREEVERGAPDQYRACLLSETGQEDGPRTRRWTPGPLPRPATRRAKTSTATESFKTHPNSTSRGRSSSTSSTESSNVSNSSDSISFNSTNSSGSTFSTGNSTNSSTFSSTGNNCSNSTFSTDNSSGSTPNSDNNNTSVKINSTQGRSLFTFGRKSEMKKRRAPHATLDVLGGGGAGGGRATSSSINLKFSLNGKASDTTVVSSSGVSVIKSVSLKSNSLSSNSSCDSRTSSNSSSTTRSLKNFFHRGGAMFSGSFKVRNSSSKRSSRSNSSSNTSTTTHSSSSSSSSTDNSRFLLPADSVTNIVVVGDKGVGKSAITVRFLTRRYIGEYSSDSEMMYQHDTTVDHAPACLQLLDVTTMQTPYQILSHLSWAHAFVVVYDITSRTSFIHARQLLHILQSHPHIPTHPPATYPEQTYPCQTGDYSARNTPSPRLPNERVTNISPCGNADDTGLHGDYCASHEVFSESSTTPPHLICPRPLNQQPGRYKANHRAFMCSESNNSSPSSRHGTSSFLSVSPPPACLHGNRAPQAHHVCHRAQRHAVTHTCHSCPGVTSCDGHLRRGLHATLSYATTTAASDDNSSYLLSNHVYYHSHDNVTPAADSVGVSFDTSDQGGECWLPPEKINRRTPFTYIRNCDSFEGRQGCGCVYERCNNKVSLPRGGCSSASPLRTHTTLLLGNKRDLEHCRCVWTDEGEALSLEFSCQFYEVSAAESLLGIHLAFHSLLKEARALQFIRSLPHGNSQGSAKGMVSSAVSRVIGNFFTKAGKDGHKRQSHSI